MFARHLAGSTGRSAVVIARIYSAAESSAIAACSSTVGGSSTFQFRHDFSVSSTAAASADERSYKLVVLGGGSAGCAIASKFASSLGKGRVAVVEPSEVRISRDLRVYVDTGILVLQWFRFRLNYFNCIIHRLRNTNQLLAFINI